MGLNQIYKQLGFNVQNGLCLMTNKHWKGCLLPRTEKILINILKPVSFFCLDKKPLILFYDSPKNKKELFQDIWNFNESPVVIIKEGNSVEIFNGFSYFSKDSALETLEDGKNIENFSYFEFVTGRSLQKYSSSLKYQKRVDYRLLNNIRVARDILINKYKVEKAVANALIGKVIFIRYLIDRNVRIKFDGDLREWKREEFYPLLDDRKNIIKFFAYLNKQFKGEVFSIKKNKLYSVPTKAFVVLKNLLEGTELESGQTSLFNIYNFSIIPVEFISNVYEHFIGKEDQAKKGAYYTPLFIVDYILSETVEKYFKVNPDKYNCKVLDPSCGSGIFLVEALRKMIERYRTLNQVTSTTEKFKKALKQLAEDNIFGIDKDENAINVAIFSIYLTLLDYQEPKDIENFTFPDLKKNGNFSNSDFFDLKADFNNRSSSFNYNIILGNPPWKRGKGNGEEPTFSKYIKYRKKKELKQGKCIPKLAISNKEIAQAFLLRVSDFSSKYTQCALIVTSKTLYNLKAKDFRQYFLHYYYVDKVLELAPVRKEVFRSAKQPAVVLFYRYSYSEKTTENIVEHITIKPNCLFSLFKIFTIQRNDYKRISQINLKDNDWLWKVLVWGSYQDFNFLKRLQEDYISINKKIKKENLLIGQGLIVGTKNKKYSSKDLLGKPLIDHKKDIEQYHVHSSLKWSAKAVTRVRNKKIFKAPILLIKHGLKKFKAIAAISYLDVLYKHSLTGIKDLGSQNTVLLKTLCGLLNSDMFAYYMIHTTSAGADRGRAHDEEKLNFPYLKNMQIAKDVEKIEIISRKIFKEKQKIINTAKSSLLLKKNNMHSSLNEKIFKSFNLNMAERTLVDYALKVTIPLIIRPGEYKPDLFASLDKRDNILLEYVTLFISRFTHLLKKGNNFNIEIWQTKYIVSVFFTIIDKQSNENQIIWKEQNDDTVFRKIAKLGIEKKTERLFLHKDIRGFEKNGFYIIKPNEKKLWHKAMAYLDIDEFVKAILKAGKEAYNAQRT